MELEPIEGAPPPLKQAPLAALLKPGCAWCGKTQGMLQPLPLFWRLTCDRFGVDVRAVQRQAGLAQFMGSSAMASVMGPDENMAVPLMATRTVVVCEPCMTGPMGQLAARVFGC